MKKKVFFSFLTTLLGIFAIVGCNKIDDPDKPFYIAGTWLGSHIDDEAQRVVCFEENKGTANYVTSYFIPDYSKEELEVPFTFDKRSGEVVMDFSGIQNAAGISQIVLNANELEGEVMAGFIYYSETSHKPDTFLLSRMDNSFEKEDNPGGIEYHSNIDMGPRNPLEELPELGWENPFNLPLSANETDNVATESILLWVGSRIGNVAVTTLATKLFNALWNEILPIQDPTAKNIKKIVQDLEIIKKQLEEINMKLDELIKLERLKQVTENLTARNNTFIKLNSSVSNILRIIENEIKGADPETASRNIQKAILEWGASVCDGSQVINAVDNYVKISKTAYGFHSYPELYDDFAYETIAWECDGYEWREMLRATDEALVSVTSALTVMYWTAKYQNKDISEKTLEEQINNQVELLKEMGSTYVSKAVERHPDKMICQIYGFHMVFNRAVEWHHLYFPGWYPPGDKFDLNPEYLVFGKEGGVYMSRYMTEGEYNTLMKYYSNDKGSLLSIFKKIGFDIDAVSPDAANAMMLLPNGAKRIKKFGIDNENFDIIVKKAISNYKKAETNVLVGEVYAPRKYYVDTWGVRGLIYIFNKYNSYSNYTWFNLEVQQRLK